MESLDILASAAFSTDGPVALGMIVAAPLDDAAQIQAQLPTEGFEHVLPEDSGLIRCICTFDDDDGYTIQCDRCFAWQHGLCLGIEPGSDVPETFLCELCRGVIVTGTERQAATERQIARRAALQKQQEEDLAVLNALAAFPPLPPLPPPLPRGKKRKQSHAHSQTDSAVLATFRNSVQSGLTEANNAPTTIQPAAPPPPKRKKSGRHRQSTSVQIQGTVYSTAANTPAAVISPLPPPTPISDTPVISAEPEFEPPPAPPPPPVTRRSVYGPSSLAPPVPATPSQVIQPEDALDEKFETWQFEYTPVKSLLWNDGQALEQCKSALKSWFDRNEPVYDEEESDSRNQEDYVFEVSYAKQKRSKHVHWTRRKWLKGSEPDRIAAESLDSGGFKDYDAETDFGLQFPLGVVEIPKVPANSRVSVKVVPPASLAFAPPQSALFSNGSNTISSASCPYPRATQYALFAATTIPAGAFVAPLHGQVLSLETYKHMPANQYSALGVPKPHNRALVAPWSIVVDQRMFGSECRYARSGCHPNAIVRPVVHKVQTLDDNEESFQLDFGIFALGDITKREEIILPWDWDDAHIIHLLPPLLSLSTSSVESMLPTMTMSRMMAKVASTLLGVTACACERKNDCAVRWFWKLASASQPTNSSGHFRVQGEDKQTIEGKMALTLTSPAAGYLPPQARKHQKPQRQPSLGPLLSIARGWTIEVSTDGNDVSLEQDAVMEESVAVTKPTRETLEEKILPENASTTTLGAPSSQVQDSQAPSPDDKSDPLTAIFDEPITETPIAVSPPSSLARSVEEHVPTITEQRSESAVDQTALPTGLKTPMQTESEVKESEVTETPTVMEIGPAPPLIQEEPAAVEKEPSPPPRIPTPPIPRAKLSFADYRKRMSERKPDEAPLSVPSPIFIQPLIEGGTLNTASAMDTSSSVLSTGPTPVEANSAMSTAASDLATRPVTQTPTNIVTQDIVETPAAMDVEQKAYFPSASSLLGFQSRPYTARFTSPAAASLPVGEDGSFQSAEKTAPQPPSGYFPSAMSMQFKTSASERYRSPSAQPDLPVQDLSRSTPAIITPAAEKPVNNNEPVQKPEIDTPIIRGRSPTPLSPIAPKSEALDPSQTSDNLSRSRNNWQPVRYNSPPPYADDPSDRRIVSREYERNRSPPRGQRYATGRDSSQYRPRNDNYRGNSRGYTRARTRGRGWPPRGRGSYSRE